MREEGKTEVMSDIKFFKKLFYKFNSLLNNDKYFNDLIKVKDILKKTH